MAFAEYRTERGAKHGEGYINVVVSNERDYMANRNAEGFYVLPE